MTDDPTRFEQGPEVCFTVRNPLLLQLLFDNLLHLFLRFSRKSRDQPRKNPNHHMFRKFLNAVVAAQGGPLHNRNYVKKFEAVAVGQGIESVDEEVCHTHESMLFIENMGYPPTYPPRNLLPASPLN